MCLSNIINAVFINRTRTFNTPCAYQYDYGQILKFIGLDLPAAYEVHFSNEELGEAVTQIGNADGVTIPDSLFLSGSPIHAWLYLHTGDRDGETEYHAIIPVKKRAAITEDVPDPVDESVISQAISALNKAVEKTGQDVEAADAAAESATAAQVAAENAQANAEAARDAADASAAAASDSANNVLAYKKAAELAQQKAEQAQGKAETAEQNAETAKEAARSSAAVSAESARISIDSAAESAASAQTAASNAAAAQQSANRAASHKADAQTASANAQAYSNSAADNASAAAAASAASIAAKNESEQIKAEVKADAAAAESAKSTAVSAKTDAEAARDTAVAAAVHSPKIEDGTWHVWDQQTYDYVDTDVEAQGPRGERGEPGLKGDPGDDYVLTEEDKAEIAEEAAQTLAPELETKADKAHLQELEDKYIPDIQFLVKENILEANGISADELHFEYSLPDDVDKSDRYYLWLSREMSGSTGISSDDCCFVEIEVTNADDSVDDYVFIKSEPRDPVFDICVNNWYSGIKSMNYSPGWQFYFSKDEDDETIYTYISFPGSSKMSDQMSDIIRNAKSIAFTAWEAADNNWKYIQYKPPIMPGTGARAVVDNIDLELPAQRENVASGVSSHAEGFMTAATAKAAHSEGRLTTASGEGSHAEGGSTKALGECSHAWGGVTIAASKYQTAYGKYNVQDDNNEYAEIIGNGTYKTRSNARALTWTGDEHLAGDVYVHSEADSSGGNKLATENYVDDAVSHISSMAIHICTAQEYDAQTGIPTITNPDAATFYLVPGGDAPNLYVEWAYVNNAWEQFGSASIDLSNYVQKTDYATSSDAGVVKIGSNGITLNSSGVLVPQIAIERDIKTGTTTSKLQVPANQHISTFYGFAKASGDATQSQSSNPVGTYTPEAKTAIKKMLDAGDRDTVSYLANAAWNEKVADAFFYTELTNEDFDSERETETNLVARVNADPVTSDELGYASYVDFVAYDANNDEIYHVELVKGVDGGWFSPFIIEVTGDDDERAIYPMKFIEAKNLKIKASSVGNEKYIVDFTLQCKDEAFKNQLKNAAKFSFNVYRIKNVGSVMIDDQDVVKGDTAYIPFASDEQAGVVKVSSDHGLAMNDDNQLELVSADETDIKDQTDSSKPITPALQHAATFYGLATAAGDWTQASSENYVGEYTDEAKGAIQSMLGITQMLAPTNPNMTAAQAYGIGEVFAANGKLYKATAAIAQDAAIIPDTNCVETTMAEAGGKIKDVQVAGTSVVGSDGVASIPTGGGSANKKGVVWTNGTAWGIRIYESPGWEGALSIVQAEPSIIKTGNNGSFPITSMHQHDAVYYGLSKVAGVDLANETVTLGTYPEASKTAIKEMLGVQDGLKVVRLI